MPGDPVLNLSSSTNLLSVAEITTTPFNGIECQTVSLLAVSDSGDGSVYWFDSATESDSIFYGTEFNPEITESTTYWVSPFENGECPMKELRLKQ